MNASVSIIKCPSYEPERVLAATRRALDSIGGIGNFIKPKSKVLLKPNLLMAKEPEYGVCTHPEVVRSAIRLLKEIGCTVYLGDGPSVWDSHAENIEGVYEVTGMKKIAREEKVELVRFEKKRWRKKFPLSSYLDDCDHLVSLPKFKTHGLTLLTGAIKNLYGLVYKTHKADLHMRYFAIEDFSRILVDIYEEARPALTIVDGIVAMEGDGPATSGKLRDCGLVFAARDCVALDSVLAEVMGIHPLDVPTTKEAARRGLGVCDTKYINISGESMEEAKGTPFKLPATSLKRKLPRPLIALAQKLIHFYPKIDYNNCIRCGACIEACPQKTIKLKSGRILIDYAKCMSCFCCQEVCPNKAMGIGRSLLAKLLGL